MDHSGTIDVVPDSKNLVTSLATPLAVTTPALTESLFERSGYVAVLNRCAVACELCTVLGCLHGEERSPESVKEAFRRFAEAGLRRVTVPPNTLLYAHREALLESALELGLKPVLRIHPAVGVSAFAGAIADWAMQGGDIEAVVDSPWSASDQDFLSRLNSMNSRSVRSLLVPTRTCPIVDLATSLPPSMRSTAEVLFPLPHQDTDAYLSCDDVHAVVTARAKHTSNEVADFQLRPSRSYDRPDLGLPSWFETEPEAIPLLKSSSLNPAPQVSIIIPSLNRKENLINTLRHLQRQDTEANLFEVVIVDDGSDDGTFERIREHMLRSPMRFNLRYYLLPRPFRRRKGDALFRAGIARNFGVRKSSGATLVFLDSNVLVPTDFLSDIRKQSADADVLQYEQVQIPFQKSSQRPRYQELDPRRDGLRSRSKASVQLASAPDWSALPMPWKYVSASCLIVKRAHFQAVGGFARSFRSYGMEDMLLGWQLSRLGLKWRMRRKPVFLLRPSDDSAEHGHSRWRKRALLTRSAQNFYLLTLDEDFYNHYFALLGRFPSMRAIFPYVGKFARAVHIAFVFCRNHARTAFEFAREFLGRNPTKTDSIT
ncbi:MAG: glycosyltransferase [Bdellovibrionaceae bacterium]|nr:glycosyltransferase [Pseudobdellovibrionaceae bacterium]